MRCRRRMMDKVMTMGAGPAGEVYDPMTLPLRNFKYVPPYFLQAATIHVVIL